MAYSKNRRTADFISADGTVAGSKIPANAIDSDHYVDGSIDTAHIAVDQITNALIPDNAINSEHYTDGSIDTAHIAADQITSALIADDQINSEHIADSVTLGGNPTTTTQSGSNTTTRIATTAFVQQELTTLIGGAPSTLNDLNELAAAINDDANYNSTLTTALATKATIASPTFTGNINGGDNVKLRLGAGPDLEIYHDGSNSYIRDTGTGSLVITSPGLFIQNAAADENIIRGLEDGAVTLYHSGNAKLDTTSSGIDVTGAVNSTGEMRITNPSATSQLYLYGAAGEKSNIILNEYGVRAWHVGAGTFTSGELSISDGTTERLGLTTAGIDVTGTLIVNTDADSQFKIGDGGTNAITLYGGSGDELYMGANNTYKLRFQTDGNITMDNGGNFGIGTASPSAPLTIATNDSTTNDVVNSLMITNSSTGTTVPGFGGEIRFQAERNNGVVQNTGRIASVAEVNSGSNISSGLSFWASAVGVITEKMRISYDGKVGIGETVPLGKLHIKEDDSGGTVNSNFDQLVLEDDSHSGMTILSGTSSDGGIYFGDSGGNNMGQFKYKHLTNAFEFATNNGSAALTIASDDQVGIGTASPSARLHIDGMTAGEMAFYIEEHRNDGISGHSSLCFIDVTDQYAPFAGLRIDHNGTGSALAVVDGKVSIGVLATDYKLQINGSGTTMNNGTGACLFINTTDNTTSMIQLGCAADPNAAGIGYHRGNDRMWMTCGGGSENAASNSFVLRGNGNVGIGVTSPGHKLSVNGTSEFYNTMHMHSSLYLQWTGGVYWSLQNTNSSNDFRFTTVPSGGAEHFRIAANGTLTATDTTIGSNSDSRLKENIENYSYDINKFKSYEPRIFDWKNPSMHGNKSQQIGFIAQEQEIIDNRFIDNIKLDAEDTVEDNPDIALIDEDRLMKTSKLGQKDAMYVSVIQQLITRLETAEAKIAVLEG